jgi:hypothetical protein
MSAEISFDRGVCQGQVKRSEFTDKKTNEPIYRLEVSTPGGAKKFKVQADRYMSCADGDLVLCEYQVKTFTADDGGSGTYNELLAFEVTMPAAIIKAAFEKAQQKRAA